jgi:osmotically-inducible protein OsmY
LVTTKVKTTLFDDNILRGVGISVDTFGGDATLTGTVENENRREGAAATTEAIVDDKI